MQLIRLSLILLLNIVLLSVSINAKCSSEVTPLRIAVAANFSPVLEKLIPQFTQQSQIPVQVINGASGTLFLQISHGAPFDIFLSADSTRPQKLKDDGLIISNSLHTYAYGQLALWSASNDGVTLESLAHSINDSITNSSNQRFAIANPNTAPYGKAAKETLETLNLWQQVQSSLVTGININQTFQQIRSQAVNVGIVANSQLVLNQLTGTVIPSHYHQPIKQQLVILKSSKQVKNAKIFSQFLLSNKIQQQLKALGYSNDRQDL